MSEAPSTSTAPHHRLALRADLGALAIDVALDFHAPWTVLFGPSGSGKSTLLHFMAGVASGLRAASPAGTQHFSRRASSETWLPLTEGPQSLSPEHRAIAFAPQAAALFPHLSVAENVRFAEALSHQRSAPAGKVTHSDELTRYAEVPRTTKTADTAVPLSEQASDLFELRALWSRLPRELSGGEQQRVNLARAFARPGARLMLLDEPFTGMDRQLRDRILPRLRAALAQRQLPVISVTHDLEEAFLLEADVARMEAGHLLDQGPAPRVLQNERLSLLNTLRKGGTPTS